jgi:adenylate cyclase
LRTLGGFELEIPFVQVQGYNANLPELQAAAYGAGFFDNKNLDVDGVYRRAPLVYRYGKDLYESLSFAVVRGLYGQPPIELGIADADDADSLEWLNLGDTLQIPVDNTGSALIPYRGLNHSFPYISATDVLKQKADPKALDGAIVLLGTTAPGLMDMRSTPVENVFPGVEVHANLIAGMLDRASPDETVRNKAIRHRPAYTQAIESISVLAIGMVLSLLLPILSPLWGGALSIGILAIAVGLNLYFWNQGLVIPLASLLLLILALVLFHNAYGFFFEARGKHRMGQLFGQYVPPEIVNEMSTTGGDFGLGGESREMTVLFSDIFNFTTMSETMDPANLARMMNAYLTSMTELIQEQRGTIDKYIGDAIMAFWGAPLDDPQHARRSVICAMEMAKRMDRVRADFKAQGWPELKIGIGINTGMMNVGNMGSKFRMTYTVLGDAVNLGSRLEGLTRKYGITVIVSEFTKAATEQDIEYRELDRVQVKGKEQLVTIYEPIGLKDELSEESRVALTRYREALAAYQAGEFDHSRQLFASLAQQEPEHKLYRFYLDQISQNGARSGEALLS